MSDKTSIHDMEMQCFIWSHEHQAWWKAGMCGYTMDPLEAGLYPLKDAIKICESAHVGVTSCEPKDAIVPSGATEHLKIQAKINDAAAEIELVFARWGKDIAERAYKKVSFKADNQ